MGATPYPLPRNTRETAILTGDGVSLTFGPFTLGGQALKIFGEDDVEVWTKPAGAAFFALAAVTITKSVGFDFDTFTVTFAAALAVSTQFVVSVKRLHEREVAVTKGGVIDTNALEQELSKQGTVIEELRRDVERGFKADYGFAGGRIEFGTDAQVLGFDVASGNLVPRNLTSGLPALTTNYMLARLADIDSGPEAISIFGGVLSVPNAAFVQALTGLALRAINLQGVNFEYDAADVTTVHDGETCLVTLDGKRYKPVGLAGPAVLRTILLDIQAVRMLKGTGDGDPAGAAVTAETLKFQTMCNTLRDFSIPEPLVTYRVNQINVPLGQQIEGCGLFSSDVLAAGGKFQFTGNGVNPVFVCGDGTGNKRHNSLKRLSITNAGASCVVANVAPNIIIEENRLFSTGAGVSALDLYLSYRAKIVSNYINSSGADSVALTLRDNMNAALVTQNTLSGGTLGYASIIEQSQSIIYEGNIIESSKYGLAVSSQNPSVYTGGGNCNGFSASNNYWEQVTYPCMFGLYSTVVGLRCSENYGGNSIGTILAPRTAAFHIGRVLGGIIENNALYMKTSANDEDLYWFYSRFGATNGFNACGNEDLILRNNRPKTGKPVKMFRRFGQASANAAYIEDTGGAANQATMASLGATMFLDEANSNLTPTPYHQKSRSSQDVRITEIVWDTTATMTQRAWLRGNELSFGGILIDAEVTGWDGVTALTGAAIALGFTGAGNVAAQSNTVDLAALTWSDGSASLLAGFASDHPILRRELKAPFTPTVQNNTIRCSKGSAGNTTLRILLHWRAS